MALFCALRDDRHANLLRRPPLLKLRILLLHIADNGLPTVIHMDMFDADKLLPAVAQALKDFNLGCISPHQTRQPGDRGAVAAGADRSDLPRRHVEPAGV